MQQTRSILCIDDENMIRETIADFLMDSGFNVAKAQSAAQAQELIDTMMPDLILLDINMPEMSGLEFLEILQKKHSPIPVIIISGAGEMNYVIQALRLGAWDYITKPLVDMNLLEHSINKALEKRELQSKILKYQEELEILVQEQFSELVTNEERLSLALDATNDGIWDLNFQNESYYFSPRCFELLGYTPAELTSTPSAFIQLLHPEDQAQYPLFFTSTSQYADGSNHITLNLRFKHKNQSWKWFLVRGKIISMDDKSHIMRITGAFTDITAQKQTEQKLIRYTSDMEQYIYIYSHDLKEPLRMLTIFLQLLETDYKKTLDEESTYYLEYAIKSSDRMQDLISSMLTYTKISNNPLEKKPTHLKDVLNDTLSDLALKIQETQTTIHIASLPEVFADPQLLYHVFYNLILNALKFQKNNAPQIDIFCEESATHWRISVKDNGIGLKQEYSQKIFTLFHRLHHKDEYEGTGIGLAICKRIIEQHGGEIDVVSEPDKGATFSFTLPKIG